MVRGGGDYVRLVHTPHGSRLSLAGSNPQVSQAGCRPAALPRRHSNGRMRGGAEDNQNRIQAVRKTQTHT